VRATNVGIAPAEEDLSSMPNLRSSKKRMRIEAKRHARNKAVKSTVRTYVTKARTAINAAPAEPETEVAIHDAISQLDRAVTKGVLHRNNAARRKSRLMARLHAAQAEA
jgi:small subunit ribosomal protein S20